MRYSRRKFIVSSILASTGVFMSASPFNYSFKFLTIISDPVIENLLTQASSARENGNFSLAESLYNQIISLVPEETRAYYGLRKTFLMQKNKEYNVVILFEQAVDSNPENIRLICQLAKEYTSVALGNKQVVQMLNYETPLLEKAYDLYEYALSLDSNLPSLFGRGENTEEGGDKVLAEVGLEKNKTKIDQQADTEDARGNSKVKEQRKVNQLAFKGRFKDLTYTELNLKLNKLLEKPDLQKRGRHIKELYRIMVKRKIQNKDYENAYLIAYQLYLFDKKDTISLGLFKKYAIRTQNYNQLVEVLRDNDLQQNTFWSKLSYFDSLCNLYKATTNNTTKGLMLSVLWQLADGFELSPLMKKELEFRKLEFSLVNQNIFEIENHLIETGKLLFGFRSPHDAVRFSKFYSRFFILDNKRVLAINFIDLLINPEKPVNPNLVEQHYLYNIIAEYNRNVKIEKNQHLDQFYNLREKLYNNSLL